MTISHSEGKLGGPGPDSPSPGSSTRRNTHVSPSSATTHLALSNIVAILAEASAKPHHIVRMTWYVTDKDEYMAANRDIGKVYKELVGHFGIAMTAVQVAGLVEVGAKVEIEVTAVLPD